MIQIEMFAAQEPINWDDCNKWGTPLHQNPHSDSRYFYGNTYALMRQVIQKEWLRTYTLWRRDLIDVKSNPDELLEVAYYLKEAIDGNYKNQHEYIAARLGCDRFRVMRLLRLISIDMFQEELGSSALLGQNVHSISEGAETTWRPSRADVRKKMAGIKRICAGGYDGCAGDSTTGKVSLCLSCHRKASEEYGLMTNYPHWLLEEIKRIENEHRKASVDACYEDYHGTVSIDELESYLDAG